ncbi:Transcriptional regulator, TetR family [Frankia canadensis]|uniref:Transcriptional regulator, TetR family n=1 Tax=Frankia canadensis TaxID=1836972 RepID=A0A2I2KRQ3_9ACTN|nr:TetR/AcrR family transcriptional regulator [Frankia canadensis]SNQ48332.1 Transcriptional regulator, TetR family [Frankia canadensis]SOU55622.1 Transcriptional regulator, TetR family [Frankia canadensis]
MTPTATPRIHADQSAQGQPVRADAARNRARVLSAARSVFAAQGADASLHEVARFAGVGVGTVYRHFATREALLEAVLSDRFESLRQLAAEPAAGLSAEDALLEWIGAFVRHLTAYRWLASSLMPTLHHESSLLYQACREMRMAVDGLLRAAQAAGSFRSDLDTSTLLKLINAIALTAEQTSDDGARLLDFVMTGLRPRS